MKIKFWGVRGSIPAPGPETNRYGGNTACVSITTASGALVIIDMGTGLMHLGNALMAGAFPPGPAPSPPPSSAGTALPAASGGTHAASAPPAVAAGFGKGKGRATILLSHTHWDHIQGLGFFPPVFVGGNQFTVWGPGGSPKVLEDILEGQMDPNFSPLQTLKNLAASFDVAAITCGTPFEAEGLSVVAREHAHGATTALSFRIEEAGRVFVYASDVGYPESGPPREAIEHYRGADVLLHDTTYRPEHQATRRNRGFSSYEEACTAAIAAQAKRLVTFHYDQDYTDDDVDKIVAACAERLAPHGIGVVPAREGDELEV